MAVTFVDASAAGRRVYRVAICRQIYEIIKINGLTITKYSRKTYLVLISQEKSNYKIL